MWRNIGYTQVDMEYKWARGGGEGGKVKREVDSVKSAKNLKHGERIGGK